MTYRIVMSAYKEGRTEVQNRWMHALLMQHLLLHLMAPEVVLGQYKGVPEVSVMFSSGNLTDVQHLLREFGQECALVLSHSPDNPARPTAYFIHSTGKHYEAGFFIPTMLYPEGQDYTFWRGQWWVLSEKQT